MYLIIYVCGVTLLLLGHFNRSSALPLRTYQELEEFEEQRRAGKVEDELWLLKRLLERNEVEQELDLGREELQRQQRNEVHPRAFLERFGYLPELPTNVSHEPTSMKKAILRMQKMYHIKESGELDEKTLKMMLVPRCGMPDMTPKEYIDVSRTRSHSVNDLNIELIANNFFVPGYKWKKLDLTWRLKNYHQLLTPEVTKTALRRAFKFWSDVSGLTFTETEFKADINMEFVWGAHQDGPQNAFDGPGGVLAHAFYPESGETHFDQQESWTDGKAEGINLMIVATHELGHALGLGHSNIQGALMAPYYQGYDANFKLPDDDINAIRSLYGGPRPSNGPSTTRPSSATVPQKTKTTVTSEDSNPTQPTNGPPNTCELVYKAITQTHDYRIYIFNGRWMWRTSEYGLDQGFPLTISTYYENPPENISAALFSWKTYHTYFFKGKRIWKYYGFQLVETKTVQSQDYPDGPKAAFASTDSVIYLFKGGNLWKFDEEKLDVSEGSSPISFEQRFPGAPTNFDSVVRLVNDPHLYFFRGQNYLKYSEDSRKVLDGYPMTKSGPWMGPACGAKPYTPK